MRKMVIFGYGLVGQSLHRLIKQDSYFDTYNIFVLEKDYKNLDHFIKNGGNKKYFFNEEINLSNYKTIYSKYLKSKDVLIDLSIQTKNIDSLNWCLQNNVHYLSTSDSSWIEDTSFINLYQHFKEYIDIKANSLGCATCLIEFGMNPGLVSLFVKQCLINIVNNSKWNFFLKRKLSYLLKMKRFNKIAKILKLETVVVVDFDNSITDIKYQDDVLYNTWNCHSLYCEFFSNAEIAIGTSFNILSMGNDLIDYVDKDGFCLLKHRGYNVTIDTWSPFGYFKGHIISHDEIYSIGRWLSLQKNNHTIYKPTVMFCYKPCDLALKSLNDIKKNFYLEPIKQINLNNNLISGGEYVGVILIGKKIKSRCFGNYIDVKTLNKMKETPTILQVSSSCVSGLKYLLNNHNKGLLFPEDLPADEILESVSKYLGSFIEKNVDWKFSYKNIKFSTN